ncbi:MAG TPA: hypothetical protein ENN49_03485 [Bacteroidales bacterium]|nr:hypothetical protein [Bacteroidales bacterium]
MKKIVTLLLLLFIFQINHAQVIIKKPFAAELSHPELTIDQIAIFPDSTVVSLTVVNNADSNGWFCADKNIFMENLNTRQRYYRIDTHGIPTCPATHNFSRKGETLSFKLIFPPIPKNLNSINLMEDCNMACFFFKGVILSNKLNSDIRLFNLGMEFYAKNEIAQAVECFTRVVEDIPANPTHVYGYAYYHLVMIYNNKGDKLTAGFWLNQLKTSTLPNKDYFVRMVKRDTGME